MKLCFVVHRYAPFPGGSEYYVQAMAEESLRRGHEVTVFAGEHRGDLNGIHVTSEPDVLEESHDLIVVHGGDVAVQNSVLSRAADLANPVLYLLILPSNSRVCRRALHDCDLLGWSTPADRAHLEAHGVFEKGVRVRHGTDPATGIGAPGFRKKHGIADERTLFVSCGGYWRHKRMKELAKLFEKADTGALLVTTGYDDRSGRLPVRSENVLPLLIENRADVLSAIAEADAYIMHSESEGFGLVLLEAMLNETPWIARDIAGATLMREFGTTYSRDGDLVEIIKTFRRDEVQVQRAKTHVLAEHLIADTVDDLERAADRVSEIS